MKRLVILGIIGTTVLGCTASTGEADASTLSVKDERLMPVTRELSVFVPAKDSFIANTEMLIEQLEQAKIEEAKRLAEEERLRQLEIQKEEERKANVGFNSYDLLEVSGITGDEMYELLKDRGVRDVAYTLVEAEQTYGVNALLLAGLICLESGWGESPRSTGWTNNMSGMGVPSDHSVGYVYESRQASVLDTARQLKKHYLTEGGLYYNGTSIWNVNTKYCVSNTWADKILTISNSLLTSYREFN